MEEAAQMQDWYDRRHELGCEQVFRCHDGHIVKLDRGVPGDGTKWYVANWNSYTNGWTYEDGTIEPGELAERLADDYGMKAIG